MTIDYIWVSLFFSECVIFDYAIKRNFIFQTRLILGRRVTFRECFECVVYLKPFLVTGPLCDHGAQFLLLLLPG